MKRAYVSDKKSKFAKRTKSSNSITRNPSVDRSGAINRYQSFPRIASISAKRIVVIPCSATVNYSWQTGAGVGLLNGGAPDIVFAVLQSGVIQSQGNSAWGSVGSLFNNYAQCASVFQEYRITKFEIDVYYSANSNPLDNTAAGNAALPMVYALTDRDNARSVQSAATALQYPNCKVMQMGNSSGPTAGRQSIVLNSPSCFAVNLTDATLVGTNVGSQLQRSPWLSCGTNNNANTAASIPHGFIKFFIDPVNAAATGYRGVFTFVCRAVMEYRGID